MKFELFHAGTFRRRPPSVYPKDPALAKYYEKPQDTVQITRPFYLGVTEVTQGQYRAVTGQSPSRFKGTDDLPVEQVSWYDAVAFCNSLSAKEGLTPYYWIEGKTVEVSNPDGSGYRLPTEAEWEYAYREGCKAPSNDVIDNIASVERIFSRLERNSDGKIHKGDTILDLSAWYSANSGDKTHPVGKKYADPRGLFDMRGNVWEWCGPDEVKLPKFTRSC